MKRVVWSIEARDDYRDAISYIAAQNPAAARLVQDRLKRAIVLLRQRHIGRPGRVEGTFEKLALGTRYIIVYAIDENALSIARLIHASRDWPEAEWPKAEWSDEDE